MEKPFYYAISRKSLEKVLQTLGVSVVKCLSYRGYYAWKLSDATGNEVGLAADTMVATVSWSTIRTLVKDICEWANYFVTYKLDENGKYIKNPFHGAHSLYEMKVLGELNAE